VSRRVVALVACLGLVGAALVGVAVIRGGNSAAATAVGPLHTGADGVIYDAADRPVRLVGFNWTGTEFGGRDDGEKSADSCGVTWRVPSDSIGGLFGNYDSIYSDIRNSGYNVIRVPISWNNLEPTAPMWDEASESYTHEWNPVYLTDLKSMVRKARAAGLMVILDMHQDYWSPALRKVTKLEGKKPHCEGSGMPRWLYPTLDAKKKTTEKDDVRQGANWFYRNIHDPTSTTTQARPWQLLYAAWDQLAYQFSAESGFADYQAVVGADLLNAPHSSYVGGNPQDGQSVLAASGIRLRALYDALAPAITARNPSWLLMFQDSTGGYDAANPADRETPTITKKPSTPGNWVYSVHLLNTRHGTFADGVPAHDDFGVNLAEQALANARAWGVPLFIGEFTYFSRGKDANKLSESDLEQTAKFLTWAKANRVGWTFWAYVNPYRSMTVVDHTTNLPIPVVMAALGAGLDSTGSNQAPIADFTSSCTGLACSFNAESSRDLDGSVLAYDWKFGDDGTASGPAPNHVYAESRTHGVTLIVTDDQGATATKWSEATPSTSSTLYASDAFSRLESEGWGSAETGGPWTVGSTAAMFAVTGDASTMTLAKPGSGPSIYLGDVSSTTTDIQVTATLDKAATGGGTYVSVIGRRVAEVGEYLVKAHLFATGQVGVSILRTSVKGRETELSAEAIVPDLTVPPQAGIRVRFQATGTQPTTLQAKVWLANGTEPANWSASAEDSTAALQEPGAVGAKGYLSSTATNAPIEIQFDNFQAGPVE
jgi:aryl-phospho-beta-D-glucosidase BglC (GH1 family)